MVLRVSSHIMIQDLDWAGEKTDRGGVKMFPPALIPWLYRRFGCGDAGEVEALFDTAHRSRRCGCGVWGKSMVLVNGASHVGFFESRVRFARLLRVVRRWWPWVNISSF